MNAITNQTPEDVIPHTLAGFGIDALRRELWMHAMRRALKDIGVPEETRKDLEPALGHFADGARSKAA